MLFTIIILILLFGGGGGYYGYSRGHVGTGGISVYTILLIVVLAYLLAGR